ncbi:MAG: acyltransferase family protein [Mitsuaria chitosanitabida]|jgi:glucan biosynthesis protein C|uniref:acyltransferase family protein n=1 Tax=Roseateles chitosanitabidus TaxID=65048 RepID=UPI001AFD78F8|nr:acyltransferase family protein [Roseateles chitosanitabidus]MBO9689003.1 acyltransferase family protein [Roseateles chitosanitabidus]
MDITNAPPGTTTGASAVGSAGVDIDRVRATLMILGIVLHAADVFITSGDWLVADTHRSAVFDALVALIHSFRVPGFFLLSGLLFSRSLSRHSTPDLVVRQLLRLGLPLLVCWMLINGAQHALLAAAHGQDPWEAMLSFSGPIYHLWFLRDLLVLNLLVLAWVALVGRSKRRAVAGQGRLSRLLDRIEGHGPSHWMSVALSGAMASLALLIVVRLTGWAYAKGPGELSLFDLAFYAPMFFAGLAMSRRRGWLEAWLRTPLWLLPVAAFAANWGDVASDTLRSALAREMALAVQLVGIWVATGAAVGALGRLRGATSGGLGRMLSDASYTIFLIHHLLVVALALLLLPRDWPAVAKFGLITAGAFALSLAFHRWVVRPFAFMRLLFNGRLPSPQAQTAVATHRAA